MSRIKYFFKTLLRHLYLNDWGKDGHLVVYGTYIVPIAKLANEMSFTPICAEIGRRSKMKIIR